MGGVLLGRVFLARAFDGNSVADLSRVIRQVAGARREAGRPIVCLLIVDPQTDLPSEATRVAMQRTLVSLLNYCDSLSLILEGNELRQTLLRTVLRGMAASLSGQPLRVRVAEGLEAAVRLLGDGELALAELVRQGERAGVWSRPPLVDGD